MLKGLCTAAIAIAALLLLVFGLDLAIGLPFGRASMLMDIAFLICTGLLGFLSWTTLREQR